jgi:glycosyltransferase involved in cell wall biosynthesis
MSRPLVSVCVPTFNGEAYLAEALASIEAQDYPSAEVIISDDGSHDRTLAIAEDFASRTRFPCRVFRHRPDTLAGNWNFAASAAQGEYLKYLFQDDVLYPRHLSQLVASAESAPAVSLVFARRDVLFMEEFARSEVALRMKVDCAELHRGFTRLRALQDGRELLADPRLLAAGWNKVGEPSSVLVRRAVFLSIGGFDSEFRQLVDVDLYFRLMAEGKVAFVDESLSAFRVHDRQLSVVQSKSGLSEREEAMFARKMMASDLRQFFAGSTLQQLAWSAAGKLGRAPGGFRGKRLALKAWLKRSLGLG